MRHRTDNHGAAEVHRLVGAATAAGDIAGTYLTDEVFLYRVVGSGSSGLDEMVELEDCYGLDVVRVSLSVLRARRLRIVTAAAEG